MDRKGALSDDDEEGELAQLCDSDEDIPNSLVLPRRGELGKRKGVVRVAPPMDAAAAAAGEGKRKVGKLPLFVFVGVLPVCCVCFKY